MLNQEQIEKVNECGYPSLSYELTSISDIVAEPLYYVNQVFVAGRVMAKNLIGKKLGFLRIEDIDGRIQLLGNLNVSGEEVLSVLRSINLGDQIVAGGKVGYSSTGELSIYLNELKVSAKNLLTMPDKIEGVVDAEMQRRQRYLHLFSDMDTRKRMRMRSEIISFIRDFFNQSGFFEVETPMLHPIPGGANAKPFVTHHNSLDKNLFLRIAPELYLKRLLVGGFDAVYEINRSFRNEGFSSKHNPEFTMIEFYQIYKNYQDFILLTQTLISELVEYFNLGSTIQYQETAVNILNFSSKRFDTLISELGIQDPWNIDHLEKYCLDNGVAIDKLPTTHGGYFDLIFSEFIEPNIVDPLFVTHFPTEISPLAKCCADDSRVTERFELYIAGMEIANGFSELNNPIEQAERFREQVKASHNNDEAMHFDDDYIQALSYGMPAAAGAGIGIDRLIMLLTNVASIRDVILFPTMK